MRCRRDGKGQGIGAWLARRSGSGVILLLSLCILLQMLGVPATLLNAAHPLVLDESSVLEGWSIQALPVRLPTFFDFVLVAGTRLLVSVPILAGALFRPPLS
jgi:hypothetical protein